MKFRSLFAVAIALAMVASAQAVQLTVISVATHATNSAIPVGEQAVTFGIQVNQSDLVGAGTNPVLLVQDLTFAGGATGPINGANGATNKIDAQTIQTGIVDTVVQNNGAAATQGDLSAVQQTALYADSWWYNSGTATLSGATDAAADAGTITDPAFQLGPLGAVGTSGFLWTANGSKGIQAGASAAAAVASLPPVNATNGQFMMYSGFYGPNGANTLDGATLASQFHNGVLTVPIAQIVTTGDITFPGDNANAGGGNPGNVGSGTFLGVIGNGVSNGPTGNGTYNLMGGNPGVDPTVGTGPNAGWHYSFAAQGIVPNNVPEPGTFVLAGMGALGLILAWKRRK
ncbi:MAG TPA: PEP-CTERM sorting domain-containing protein [Pirellulales bacterium]|nr:PEP-CTERM sorting domain-containing protein [Pirellulales bacterium]